MEAPVRVVLRYEANVNPSVFGKYIMILTDNEGKTYSVRLKFDFDQLWHIGHDTTSTAFDFLVFSMAVYNADRFVNRARYSTDGWNRRIELTIPVVNLEAMSRANVHFTKALNFLTGDDWCLVFEQAMPYNIDNELSLIDTSVYEKVALFSGGLDSLVGFVDNCAALPDGKKILLVSHKELGKEWSDQVRILEECKRYQFFTGRYDQVLVNAGINNQGWIGEKTQCEGTFRARSILFFGAGIYCAHAINPEMPLIIPENGTISLNIPLDRGRRSACSTRTTHPVFLKRLQNALAEIGIYNQLYNPYQLKSKADMMEECCQDKSKKQILHVLFKNSCSCAKRSHKKTWIHRNDGSGKPVLHCGFCLPCLYRRVSLAKVGWDTETVGINVFNHRELNLNDTYKRGRDFKALLYFLKYRCNKETIETELIANGVINKYELEQYANFVLHSYDQIKDWIRANGDARIRRAAGV